LFKGCREDTSGRDERVPTMEEKARGRPEPELKALLSKRAGGRGGKVGTRRRFEGNQKTCKDKAVCFFFRIGQRRPTRGITDRVKRRLRETWSVGKKTGKLGKQKP